MAMHILYFNKLLENHKNPGIILTTVRQRVTSSKTHEQICDYFYKINITTVNTL